MSSKEIWMSLYHQTLDKYTTGDLPFRPIEMLLHVLMMEVAKIKVCFQELNNKNKEYAKQLEEYKRKLAESITCTCNTQYATPPRIMCNDNEITPEEISKTEKKKPSPWSWNLTDSNLSAQDLFSEGSDVDMNSTNKNKTAIIDESPQIRKKSDSSPLYSGKFKLNSAVKRKKTKTDFISNENVCPLKEQEIFYATPITKREKKSKKFKQSKLSLHGIYPIYDKGNSKDESTLFKLPNFNESTCVYETPTSPIKKCTIVSTNTPNKNVTEKSSSENSSSESISQNEVLKFDSTYFSFKNDDFTCLPDDKLKELIKVAEANNESNLVLNDVTNAVHKEKNPSPCSSNADILEKRDYAYKNEPVRKKAERQNLDGWDCEDCEKYYKNIKYLTDEELKQRKNMCSKHRSNFNPRVLTPEVSGKEEIISENEQKKKVFCLSIINLLWSSKERVLARLIRVIIQI